MKALIYCREEGGKYEVLMSDKFTKEYFETMKEILSNFYPSPIHYIALADVHEGHDFILGGLL